MSQNDYHPQGMNGYGQLNTYITNDQNVPQNQEAVRNSSQNAMPGQGYPVQGYPGGTAFEGYHASSAQGYAAPAYQPATGYTTPQVPFIQGAGNNNTNDQKAAQPYISASAAAQLNNPYAVQAPYSIPQQGGNGSFIPQTPYSPGYTSPGYQPPQQQGYQPGYNPYGQMGRTQPNPAQQENNMNIPLNGGGYVPQKVPVRRKRFSFKDWHLIAMGLALVVLFVVAVILTGNTALKILLIALAFVTAGILWIKPVTAENRRLTYSVLALVLCFVTAVSFIVKQPGDPTNEGKRTGQANTDSKKYGNNGTQELQNGEAYIGNIEEITATPSPESNDGGLMERLVSFFVYWGGNRQDEMLALCMPSWVSKQENPRTSLFGIIANRTPTECVPESISGTEADSSRRVTLTVKIDRHNGKPIEINRMTVIMVKENNEWYVDPESVQTNEKMETPDPNVTPTIAPTDTPAIYPSTVLYYNPNKGEYYHLEQNCRNVGKKYLPLQGQFTYAEINDEPYNKLKPCNVCGAPLRP